MSFFKLLADQRRQRAQWLMAHDCWKSVVPTGITRQSGKLADVDSATGYADIDDLGWHTGIVNGWSDAGGEYGARLRAALKRGYRVLVTVWDSSTKFVITDDGSAALNLNDIDPSEGQAWSLTMTTPNLTTTPRPRPCDRDLKRLVEAIADAADVESYGVTTIPEAVCLGFQRGLLTALEAIQRNGDGLIPPALSDVIRDLERLYDRYDWIGNHAG